MHFADIYAAYNSAFDGYNKHVRPVARSTINVSLALMLFSIDEVVCLIQFYLFY